MESRYSFGPYVFDTERSVLFKRGAVVVLGQKCLALLAVLLAAEGRAVSKSSLMLAVWQTENIEESNLAVQISALRRGLGRTKNGEEWITTVQRVGYQFVNSDESEKTDEISGDKPSVAVLPFLNLGNDREQDYFSDGFTADIITELTRWRLLAVPSRGASFQYRGVPTDIAKIARDLNVRYIVEGSIRRMDERIRITVELIEAASGNHLWAEKFDRYLADLFAVQDQLVQTIVSTLVGQVQAAAVQRANRKSTSSLLAYECLLKGNSLRWDVPKESAQAMSLFMQATVLDPNYGLAYAALSTLHYRQWLDDLGSSNEALEKAHDLAKRAFELDSGESTILAALAESSLFRKQFDLAENYIARAVEVNPNNQWSVADRGCVLFRVGQAEEALRGFAQAREIDPYFNTPWYWSCLGQAYMVLERYENALASFESFPSREYWVAALTAACHARLGNVKLAEDFAAECLKLRPDFSIALRMTKEAFKIPADAKRLETSLSMSGLPK